MSDRNAKILDLSTPERKADAREALPVLKMGGMLGNDRAARAAAQIVSDAFTDALKPSFEALERLGAKHD